MKASLGGIVPALLVIVCTAGACVPDAAEIATTVATQFCGAVDLGAIGEALTQKMASSRCVPGYAESNAAVLCNTPPGSSGASSWQCDKCEDSGVTSECSANASTQVKATTTVNVRGYMIEVTLDSAYSASLEFTFRNASVTAQVPEPNAMQPGFTYVASVAQGSIASSARVAGTVSYSGPVAGSVSVNVDVSCAIGAKAAFYKTAASAQRTCGESQVKTSDQAPTEPM